MHRRRSHRSRSPRGNAQALHRSRSRIDRYEDHLSSAEDETRYTPGNFGYQTSGWHSPYSVNHDTVPTRSDDSVLGNGNYHDPVPNPEWPTSSIGDHDGTLGSNYYYSLVNSNDPAWNNQTVAYQDDPHDGYQYPATGTSVNPAQGQSATPSLSEFQPGQVQIPQTHSNWPSGADIPMRTHRRLSTRARQGSRVQLSDSGPHGSIALHNSTNQDGDIEENDSNESNGETSPVDQSQYFTSYEGDPWSPMCPRHAPGY